MDDIVEWGPIGEPVKVDAAGPGDPVYRDNAFLTFWSLAGTDPVYGEVHVSTSPNSDGRRARFTLVRGGRVVEIVEPLDRCTFTGESIDFDPAGRAGVKRDSIRAELSYTPRFAPGDYTERAVLGTVEESTLRHYQQGVDVTASIEVDGQTLDLACRGFRDRTWGYRDEPRQWIDGFGFCVTTDDFDFTCIRNMDSNGHIVTDGFVLSDSGALAVTDIDFHYDPIMLEYAEVGLADGRRREIARLVRQYTPIWFPMGPSRNAPAMTCWSEYCTYDLWGSAGEGIVGHWVRRLV